MARLWSSGFELNSTAAGVEFNSFMSTVTIQSSVVRSGTYALQITSLASGVAKAAVIPTGLTNGPGWFRAYFNYATLPTADNSIIRLSNSATGITVSHVRISSTGGLKLYNGSGPGTQIGSTSSNLNANQWYRLEIKYDKSPAAGSQTLELSIDGVVVATSSTLTLNNQVFWFAVGGNLQVETQTTGNWYFDDLAMNDSTGSSQTSYPGAGSIVHSKPAAVGDSTQWTIAGSSPAATNWQSVNEIPPDDAVTLVNEAILNKSDLYAVNVSPLGSTDSVNLVAVSGRFNNDVADATSRFQFQIEKITAGTVSKSTAIIPNSVTWKTSNTSATLATNTYPLTLYNDPDGSAWTQSTINSMQIGVIAGTVGVNKVQLTDIWALVEYIPGTGVTGYPAGLFGGTQFAYSSFSNAYGSLGSTAVQDTAELLLGGVG